MHRNLLPALLLLTLALPAQGDGASIKLDAGEHQLEELIEKLTPLAGINAVMPPEIQPKGRPLPGLRFVRDTTVQAPEALKFLSQTLYSAGFMLSPVDAQGKLYEIVSLRGSRRPVITGRPLRLTREQLVKNRGLYIHALCVLPLKHLDASRASNSLRPFFAGQGSQSPIYFASASSNALVVAGLPDQLLGVAEMLDQIDRPEPAREQATLQRLAQLEARLKRLEARLQQKAR